MRTTRMNRVRIWLAEGDAAAAWCLEILEHAGLWIQDPEEQPFDHLRETDVLVLAGKGILPIAELNEVTDWAKNGGKVVCVGSTWGLEHVLGLKESAGRFTRAEMVPLESSDGIWPETASKCVFFGGPKVAAGPAQVLALATTGEPVWTTNNGHAFIAADIGRSMAVMLMGRAVECDGIGASDGTVDLADGRLRAEDGTSLDFDLDRGLQTGVPRYFDVPFADVLREILVRSVVSAGEECHRTTLMVWPWPENAAAGACATFDSPDLSVDTLFAVGNALARFGMPAGFNVPSPGYPAEVYRKMRNAGHEPGLLAMGSELTEESFRIQHRSIARVSGSAQMPSFRPSDGGWRGFDKLYQVAANNQAELSVSKGGRKAGTSGFLFGTSHIFFAHSYEGNRHGAAELPTLIHAPGVVTPLLACRLILDQVTAFGGCLHMSSESALIDDPKAEQGLSTMLMLIKQARLAKMTPGEILATEVARRSLRLYVGDDWIQVLAAQDMPGLTLMLSGDEWAFDAPGKRYQPQPVARHGTRFSVVVVDAEGRSKQEVRFHGRLAA